jgi:hypothetical protein
MYETKSVLELRAECKARSLTGYSKMKKAELVSALNNADKDPIEAIEVKGRSVGATTMAMEATTASALIKMASVLRNKAKARRRAIRAAGGQAGC